MKHPFEEYLEREYKNGNNVVYFSDILNIDKKIESLVEEYNSFSKIKIEYDKKSKHDRDMKIMEELSENVVTFNFIVNLKNTISEYKRNNKKMIENSVIWNLLALETQKTDSLKDYVEEITTKNKQIRIENIEINIVRIISYLDRTIKVGVVLFSLINMQEYIEKNFPNSLGTKEKVVKLENELKNLNRVEFEIKEFEKEVIIFRKNLVKIEVVKELADFLKILNKIRIQMDESLFFRGHSDLKWELTPSIYRNNYILKEEKMFKEIIINHPEEFSEINSTFEKLTKMQHYELPTRLLDITINPLVALYFACEQEDEKPGEIHIFKVKNDDIKYYDSDTVSILANISKINSALNIKELLEKNDNDFEKFNEEKEIERLIHEIKEEKPYFKNKIVPEDFDKAIFVKAKFNNDRITRQRGAFIIFGISENKYNPAKLKGIYQAQKKNVRIIIPDKNAKIKILNELKRLDIHNSSLFPEIDKTSNYLKKEMQGNLI